LQAIPTNVPGVSTLGLIKIRNNDALSAEDAERRALLALPEDPAIPALTGYLRSCWGRAKMAKIPIEQQMLRNLRQRYGIYENDKFAAIQQMGGSQIYVLLTMTKCRAAEAWINDILKPVGDKPWGIKPTDLPQLPDDLERQIRMDTFAVLQLVEGQLQQAGMEGIPITDLQREIQQYEDDLRDEAQNRIQEEAQRRADRMTLKIDDQLNEGGWPDALWAVISDMITLKAGILKGPVIRKRKRSSWAQDPATGQWAIQVDEVLVPEFERISPFDVYPAPGARDIDDGYVFERHMLTRSDLVSMIGVPGYSEENIRAVLADYGRSGYREILPTDSQRAMMDTGSTLQLMENDKIEALEFWGTAQGRMLIDWGLNDPTIDPDLEYEVNAWLVGSHTIRAILNPDRLGRKPYSKDSYERVPGAWWGKGIPELMSDLQDVCNAVARAIVNNCGLASGPQTEVNTERCGDSTEIYPWKIWEATNKQMLDGPAIRFFQPELIVGPLMTVYEAFAAMSDDQTGVPRWSHGNTNVGGAGSTSSGLSMLMTSAARGIKEVIAHIDRIVGDTITRTYDYNMLYDEDESIKGDARILARGSSSLLAKEQLLMRLQEFLDKTNNPVDLQILGIPGRAKLLREAAKMLEIDVDDILPNSKEELAALVMRIKQEEDAKMQQAMMANAMSGKPLPPQTGQSAPGQPPSGQTVPKGKPTPGQLPPPGNPNAGPGHAPPPNPTTLDNAGNPAGGTDTNAFQNQPGIRP
jgi:hypothetical protein